MSVWKLLRTRSTRRRSDRTSPKTLTPWVFGEQYRAQCNQVAKERAAMSLIAFAIVAAVSLFGGGFLGYRFGADVKNAAAADAAKVASAAKKL